VISNKKNFAIGIFLMLVFAVVMVLIASPIFGGGRNGLEYADDMFNSLSKGSANYIPGEMEKVAKFDGKSIDAKISASSEEEAVTWGRLYAGAGAETAVAGKNVSIKGDMGAVFRAILKDCDAMYNNQGNMLKDKYGMEPKEATYAWYLSLKKLSSAMDTEKMFTASSAIQELMKKAVEPAYNYYGIEVKNISDYKLVVFLLMAFYVTYTLIYGFGYYFLFDGAGISMTKSTSKAEA
jgi:hypothetical protein